MARSRIYLDTSVISLLDDDRSPERRDMTREFWSRIGEYDVITSDATRREVDQTVDPLRRRQMVEAMNYVAIVAVTLEAESLARRYLDAGIFPPTVPDDALHVAVAVLQRCDVLVSWNFKHLVNQRRRAMVDSLNLSMGLPAIRILPPPEV